MADVRRIAEFWHFGLEPDVSGKVHHWRQRGTKCAFPAIVPNVGEGFWPRVISEKRSWHYGNDVPVSSAFLPIRHEKGFVPYGIFSN